MNDALKKISTPAELDKILDVTIDDALEFALLHTKDKKLDEAWYLKLLNKLGETEQNAFTMGLATEGIKVMSSEKTVDQVKSAFAALAKKQGCIYEDDYNDVCYNMVANDVGIINTWLISAAIPLKKNKPKSLSKGKQKSQYKKNVEQVVKNPNVNKLAAKATKKIRVLAQRSNPEKQQLADYLRAHETSMPFKTWQDLSKRLEKAETSDQVRALWKELKQKEEFIASAGYKITVAKVANKEFDLFCAATNDQKAKGLEVLENLSETEGMIFPFEATSHVTFHMGSVKFPIDIIFLLEDHMGLKVAKIIHNAQPGDNDLWSCKASSVIELRGGTCKDLGITIGTVFEI
jgi:uncharacterized membrane protein (UPF0127 family)